MKLLAIETATDTCSIALQVDGQRYALTEHLPRRQTERVLPMVEEILIQAGVALSSLDAIAFSQGPGAFTGVRVAVSIAQGLAFAVDVPLIGVSTLACTAQAAAMTHGAGAWFVAQDARMAEVYIAGYNFHETESEPECLLNDMLCAPDALPPEFAASLSGDRAEHMWRGVGSGDMYLEQIRQQCSALGKWVGDIGPNAEAMLPLAVSAWHRGEAVAAELAQPVYLRNQVVQGAIR